MSQIVNQELREFSFAGERGYVTSGRVMACRCGRKFLVDAVSWSPRGLPMVSACCLECVELSDEFRSDLPQIAKAIDAWVVEG